ncbi:MAG: amidohydrolase family protein [Verrucomicrobiales bacterium]|nr:amidohydrolase family protein [Verrucomicrobiales bacterium]
MKRILVLLTILCTTGNAGDLYIIDTHTHFKGEEQIKRQIERGQKKDSKNTLTQVVTAVDYRELADRLSIAATLVVEAIDHPDVDLNASIFDQAKNSDLICGYVARENLSDPEFAERYEEWKATGYLNGFRFRREELTGYLGDELARENITRLAKDGMVVDLLITLDQHPDALTLATDYPDLKIVINHAYGARMTDGQISDEWKKAVSETSQHPNVHMKISSILNFAGVAKPAPNDLDHYREILDHCYDSFGEDRVIFGTNWGVCTHWGSVDDVVRIVEEFLAPKGEVITRKAMRDNAMRVYGISPEKVRK